MIKNEIDQEVETKQQIPNTPPKSVLEKLSTKIYTYNCVRCNYVYNELSLLKDHYFNRHINNNSIITRVNENKTTAKSSLILNNLIKTTKNEIKTKNLENIATKLQTKRQLKRTRQSASFNQDDEDNDDDDYIVDDYISSSQIQHQKPLTDIQSALNTSHKTHSSIEIKKKRKLIDRDDEKSHSIASNSPELSAQLEKRLHELSEDEMKTFNLDNIDETPYINGISESVIDKKRELLAGKVVWVFWKQIMWPALIIKVSKGGSTKGGSSIKVHIRYYEMNRKLGNVFKMEPSKVELFYKCTDHLHYKVLGAVNDGQRKEFFIAYTNALKDYIEYLATNKSDDVKEKPLNNASKGEIISSKAVVKEKQKYFIQGKLFTLDDVKYYASQEFSEAQIKENEQRNEHSKQLLNVVLSDECKEYLVKIMTDKEFKCDRHTIYLNADSRTRRLKLKFTYVGPLVDEDQLKLGQYLVELCKNTYLDKPQHLTTYDYDVLYPEAVIWGLRKIYNLTYKKAESKYKQGFRQTTEELIKRKCNEILNKLSSNGKTSGTTTTNGNVNKEDEEENYQESEYNEEDTSFFAYCSQSEPLPDHTLDTSNLNKSNDSNGDVDKTDLNKTENETQDEKQD